MVGRQARAEATRQSIIDAAVELFRDVGYTETDMTDVVQHAGIPGGTCYYYFPTKSSLAEAIIDLSNVRIAAAIGGLLESDAPAMHRLISATFRFIAATEADDTARVGYQLRQNFRAFSRVQSGGPGDTHVLFGSGLKMAIVDGHVRDDINVREAARTLVAAVVGSRLLADTFSDDPFGRLADAWRIILGSIATESAHGELNRLVTTEARTRHPGRSATPGATRR